MEHLQLAFKKLDDKISESPYLISGEDLTYFDIMVWHEISQILTMYARYRGESRSQYFTKLKKDDIDWEENSPITKFLNLNNWFKQKMPNSIAKDALEKYD